MESDPAKGREDRKGAVNFPVVGIGASAGGIEAFHKFFECLPYDSGMAYVVILHLPAERKSVLADILARWTAMSVVEAVDGTPLEPNRVYVPPPHAIVTLADGHLGVSVAAKSGDRIFRPIDTFFDSLAASMREKAVGIVLSGTGSDGALGLKSIKECGGLTLAQGSNGSSPEYGEMPAGAIATGAVDLVVPVEEMARHVLRVQHSNTVIADRQDAAQSTEAARLQICELLRTHLGHDFSGYRAQTFLRRVERRMQVTDTRTLPDYIRRLQHDHTEVAALFRDLLIRVTSFFRDRETFETLESKVIPRLFENKAADGTVRVWVPGCATGEEAYSLAILLREHMDQLRATPRVQIFATDIDDSAIVTARLGRYPSTLLDGLSESRRARFFQSSQGSHLVSKEIRDLCTFSVHSLVRDPPFSRMDMVSCRNLLIYMDTKLQARVIPIFHYSLVPNGVLLLGGSESTAQHTHLFEPLDKAARIFQRRNVRGPELPLPVAKSTPDPAAVPPATAAAGRNDPLPSVGQVLQGAPEAPAGAESIMASISGNELLAPQVHGDEAIAGLQDALRRTREQLGSLEQEHQTALEELRSSNEELHSVNEELQSTNEELETSKEELQSLNEELHTVNARLTEKIDELDQSNSDLRNLFDSTEIATLFLDRHLIVRSFTTAVASIYNLIPSDQGRPLTDIVSRLSYRTLRDDVAHVLSTLVPLERRVERTDGSANYMMRLLPYREPDNKVSGVLITFVDISSIVRAEAALVEADVRKDVFLATLSHELRNPLAPIRTAAQLMQSPNITPQELSRAQSIIARQVAHMSSLLDDLLDVSRITRGAFTLKRAYVSAQSLIEAAIEEVQPALDARHHTLRTSCPPTPVWLEVDPVRITQIISNLLENAVKYTPPGGLITLGFRQEATDLIFSVRDNGRGLAPEMTSRIFDIFTRIDPESGSGGGLGIGLALSKGLVELHGGRIEARSAGLGQGSEFLIHLPNSLISSTGERAILVTDPDNLAVARRVLIADDNEDSAESMRMLLQLMGHEAHVAHDGTQALEEAKRIRPEIIMLDIGMPGLNGYEVAQRIRSEAWGGKILLIALTGWGQEEDKRRAMAAGFDHHLTKPVDPDTLVQLFPAG